MRVQPLSSGGATKSWGHDSLFSSRFIFQQGFDLFSSEAYAPAKNLLFKDSTEKLVRLPANTNSFLYLGASYLGIVRSLNKGKDRCRNQTRVNTENNFASFHFRGQCSRIKRDHMVCREPVRDSEM